MSSIGRWVVGQIQRRRLEVLRVVSLLCYLAVLAVMAKAYWPILHLVPFMGVFFGLLLLLLITFRFMQSKE